MFLAEIEATNLCNTRCLHCPYEVMRRPRGMMAWTTYETIVRQIREHVRGERFSLSFTGMGEPLLNPAIYQFIQHVSADAISSFSTNGTLLTEPNVRRLIDAGLDIIYLSFNGDDAEMYSRMTGGLSFEKVTDNMRQAVELSRGSRLRILANVCITKVNQHRLVQIKRQLEHEGVGPVIFSLVHSRGGNLQDRSVCDTPPMPEEHWICDVMRNTLFVDWRGRVLICSNDLHGEHSLGDLTMEPLAVILQRRTEQLARTVPPEICRDCNDILKAGGDSPLPSGAGGILREWVYDLYRDNGEPLSAATPPLKWIYRIYEQEKRLDRLVNRLLGIEQRLQQELAGEQKENKSLQLELEQKSRELAGLRQLQLRTAAHLQELQQLQLRTADQLQQLRCRTTERITSLEDLVHQREDKIQRLTGSFSWRATAPLRALRRRFFDGWRRRDR
jgi:pyruvate-formate lyase-activating enzyme